jgi:uncharacterized membrane protein
MKRAWLWLEVIFGAVAVTIVCTFLAYAWPDVKYGLSGWIQAVGAIVAIVGAFLIGERNAKQAALLQAVADNKKQARYFAIAVSRLGTLLLPWRLAVTLQKFTSTLPKNESTQ